MGIRDKMTPKSKDELRDGLEKFIRREHSDVPDKLDNMVECGNLLFDNGYSYDYTDDFMVMWFKIGDNVHISMNQYTELDELQERVDFNKKRWGI